MTDVSHEYAGVQTLLLLMHKQLPWSHMAEECGVSASTIKRFAHNETTNPQYRTVSVLADYAGFRLEIKRISNTVPSLAKLERNVFRLHRTKQ